MKSLFTLALLYCSLSSLAGCCHCRSACYSPCGQGGGSCGMGYGDCVDMGGGMNCGCGGSVSAAGCGCGANVMPPGGQWPQTYQAEMPLGAMSEAQPHPVPAGQHNPVQIVPPAVQDPPSVPSGDHAQPMGMQQYYPGQYFPQPMAVPQMVQPTAYAAPAGYRR